MKCYDPMLLQKIKNATSETFEAIVRKIFISESAFSLGQFGNFKENLSKIMQKVSPLSFYLPKDILEVNLDQVGILLLPFML